MDAIATFFSAFVPTCALLRKAAPDDRAEPGGSEGFAGRTSPGGPVKLHRTDARLRRPASPRDSAEVAAKFPRRV